MGSTRVAVFTHDTFGLGHVRRCSRIIAEVAEADPAAAVLLVTGNPAIGTAVSLPQTADVVKIPTVIRSGSKKVQPPHLPIPGAEVTMLRSRLVHEVVTTFAPDVFLVDNFPLGSGHELLPTLKALRNTQTRTVLGLRDILDSREIVRAEWTKQGIYEVLDRCYDSIVVYGTPSVFDVAAEYNFPLSIAEKVRYCGYVTETTVGSPITADRRAELGLTEPYVVATAGGGGDGYPLLAVFLDAVPLLPDLSTLVVTGPLMSPRLRERLMGRAPAHVVVRPFVPDLPTVMGSAAAVVSMCGYNTVTELMATGARAVVVPRTWRYGEQRLRPESSTPEEWEQLLRGRALAELGVVNLLPAEELTAERLAKALTDVLSRDEVGPHQGIALDGAATTARHLLALARGEKP